MELGRGEFSLPVFVLLHIEHVLSVIHSSCLTGFTDVSYLAYADDLLLISRTEFGLARSVRSVTAAFASIGLFLNVNILFLMGLVRLILWIAALFLYLKSPLFDGSGSLSAIH